MKLSRLNDCVKKTQADNRLSLDIDALNKSYHYHKHILFEDENGLIRYDVSKLLYSKRSVSRIESTVSMLPEKARLIIEAEVINSKKGTKWYRQYFSVPSYYRNRKIAYKMFIEMINK